MTVFEIREALALGGIDNAWGEARLLNDYFSGEELKRAIERRLSHEPLQYILGEWGFYREMYEVGPACLVPRSDTECLVEEAVKRLCRGARFLDLCTGSGCIAVSTLRNTQDTCAVAVDLFEETLSLAARNAARDEVFDRVTFLRADVLASPPDDACFSTPFDAIFSNPPYIRDAVVDTLSAEVRHEPRAALAGGEDGMCFYRAILEKWSRLLRPGGLMLLEIGYDQREEITALADAHGFRAEVLRDLGGNDRVAVLHRS